MINAEIGMFSYRAANEDHAEKTWLYIIASVIWFQTDSFYNVQ